MRELKFRVYIPDHEKFCYFTLGNFDYSDRYLHQHSYPVQQYTGLKDCSGKEIYEGDILDCGYDDSNVIAQVKYSNEFAAFLVGENALWQGWLEKAKVIGNILENPELLK